MENSTDKQSTWARFSVGKAFALALRFFGWRLLAGLIAATISLLLFGWLAEDVFENETISFDQTVRNSVHERAAPLLTDFMRVITFCGSTVFLIAFGICVVAVFYYQRHKRGLVLFLLTMLGSTVLLVVLKTAFHRARPEAFFGYALPSSYSFPSGHSLSSFCFYGILAWLVTARMKNRTAKIAVWTLAAILIFLIGLSRVYLGVHYPSDVLAGYATGIVWVVTIGLGDFFLRRYKTNRI